MYIYSIFPKRYHRYFCHSMVVIAKSEEEALTFHPDHWVRWNPKLKKFMKVDSATQRNPDTPFGVEYDGKKHMQWVKDTYGSHFDALWPDKIAKLNANEIGIASGWRHGSCVFSHEMQYNLPID